MCDVRVSILVRDTRKSRLVSQQQQNESESSRSVRILGEASSRWTDAEGRSPGVWLSALRETLAACEGVSRVTRVCVSGTSASVLAVDSSGRVCRAPAHASSWLTLCAIEESLSTCAGNMRRNWSDGLSA